MNKYNDLKKKVILKLVDSYISTKRKTQKWKPGKDWVQYSGPYFNSDEFVAGIDTLLDEWFFEERKKIPKKDPKNYVYKIILNSTYGLSNDENSFLYDPEFTMRITINGQLSLTMLYEMICEEIPNALPLMQNTDGLETMIPKQYEDKYMEIANERISHFIKEKRQSKIEFEEGTN